MKLIAMKFQGVGPYKSEYAIDFAALTRSHMFLIDGETGAGKTTILDCLSFALYGGVSAEGDARGAAGVKQRIRSRFLMDSREETYVDLIFNVGDGYYEVRRTPVYDQPKTRGDGFTTHAASAKLMRLDRGIAELADAAANSPERYFDYAEQAGHSEEIASRAAEVGVEIQRLVGLDRKQFDKTIMLAQGQFARFLQMNPEDRTKLVKDLFGAEIYERIQEELVARRKEMKGAVDKAATMLLSRIDAARTIAEHIERPASEDSAEADVNMRWGLTDDGALAFPARETTDIRDAIEKTILGVNTEYDAQAQQCEQARNQAERASTVAQARCTAAKALREAAAHERDDLHEMKELDDRREAFAANQRKLDRAGEAGPIVERNRKLGESIQDKERQTERLRAIGDQLAQFPAKTELEARHERALQVAAGEESALQELRQAEQHERLIMEAEQARERHEHAVETLSDARTALESAQAALDDLPAAETIERQLREADERLGGSQGLRDQLERCRRVLEHARQAEKLAAAIPGLQQDVDVAEQAEREAEHTVQRAQDAIDRSGAAKYSDRLVEGSPCPVCGSVDHPAPAIRPRNVPGDDELHELQERCEAKREATQTARMALQQTRSDLESQREQAEGLSAEQAEQQVAQAQERLDQLDAVRGRRAELERSSKAIAAAANAVHQAENQVAAATESEKSARAVMDGNAERAQGHTSETVRKEREAAQAKQREAQRQSELAEQWKQQLGERDALDKLRVQHQTRLDELAKTIDEERSALDVMLHGSRFETMEDAQSTALDDDTAQELRDGIARYREQVTRTQANLERSRGELRRELDGLSEAMREALRLPESQPSAYGDDGTTTKLGEAIAALDIESFEDAQRQADVRLADANERNGAMRTLGDNWRHTAATLTDGVKTWAGEVERYAPLQRMAGLANADRDSIAPRKTTLITFAITERFRDVLDRANELLNDIQGGIYELRLDDDGAGSGGMRTGLSIVVFDRRTEQERNPATLSGGETFFVSLALALALADIIQAENGGVSMDTLFVDEGFGTLSGEYLSDVMDMLQRIARNRDIGIISHVDWLKDQIAERISVSRITPDGESRLEVIA